VPARPSAEGKLEAVKCSVGERSRGKNLKICVPFFLLSGQNYDEILIVLGRLNLAGNLRVGCRRSIKSSLKFRYRLIICYGTEEYYGRS